MMKFYSLRKAYIREDLCDASSLTSRNLKGKVHLNALYSAEATPTKESAAP
jgi:hypothetical protein